jgi:hypothetical protein
VLVFLDESFRRSHTGHELGALCGVAVPEDILRDVAVDVFNMKRNSFGDEFARHRELKGSQLLKPRNFRGDAGPAARASVEFVRDLMRYLARRRLVVIGVVCFDTRLRTFKCDDPDRLDVTYRALFERLDNYMVREFPNRRAKLVFDDVDYGTNANRARAITNFFNRSMVGRGYDTIIRTPFFAVSQAENVGLQLADIVTTICGMRFQGRREVHPIWTIVKQSLLYRYALGNAMHTTLKVFQDRP